MKSKMVGYPIRNPWLFLKSSTAICKNLFCLETWQILSLTCSMSSSLIQPFSVIALTPLIKTSMPLFFSYKYLTTISATRAPSLMLTPNKSARLNRSQQYFRMGNSQYTTLRPWMRQGSFQISRPYQSLMSAGMPVFQHTFTSQQGAPIAINSILIT